MSNNISDATPNTEPEKQSPPIAPNGADPALPIEEPAAKKPRARKAKAKADPQVKTKHPAEPADDFTGEPRREDQKPEQPIPPHAEPPPWMPSKAQKVNMKLDLEKMRKTRMNVTTSPVETFRIPVIASIDTTKFVQMHPSFGGLDDPMPIWRREIPGKGTTMHLVDPETVGVIIAAGGYKQISMCGVWWGQYSAGGGTFLTAVNIESDNDWLVSKRRVYEAMRSEWKKLTKEASTWGAMSPPPGIVIPDCKWPDYTWDEILNLAFDEMIGKDHPHVISLVYGGHPPVNLK